MNFLRIIGLILGLAGTLAPPGYAATTFVVSGSLARGYVASSGGTTLPLDAVAGNYSSAESTRLIRAAWAGSIMNCQRSSDNATNAFYQGSAPGLLNTVSGGGGTDILTFGAGTVVKVIFWDDQTGNGNHWSQGTFANCPVIVNNGAFVMTQGGMPMVCFTNAFLTCNQAYAAPANYTCYIVAKWWSSASSFQGMFHPDNMSAGFGVNMGPNSDSLQVGFVRANTGRTRTTGVSAGVACLIDGSYDSSADTLLRNGGSDSGGTGLGSGWSTNPAALGTGYLNSTAQGLNGGIGEILVYSAAHSSGNKTTIRSNEDAFWTGVP